jgi:hypothetical protein
MSAMRCCRAWNLPIGPRTAGASSGSRAWRRTAHPSRPRFRAQQAGAVVERRSRMSSRRRRWPITSIGAERTPSKRTSAARWPSSMRYSVMLHARRVGRHREQRDAVLVALAAALRPTPSARRPGRRAAPPSSRRQAPARRRRRSARGWRCRACRGATGARPARRPASVRPLATCSSRRHGRRPAQELGAQHGGEVGLDHQAAAQLLHHDEHVDGVAGKAALLFRHRQRRQSQFGQRGPGLLRGAGAASRRSRGAPRSRSRARSSA